MAIVILPELPANQWNLTAWLEKMASADPGGASSFTTQDSEAVMVIRVLAEQVRSCIVQILGYAWADDATPWRLHRDATPIQHPFYSFLWADSVTVQKVGPEGIQNIDGGGNIVLQAKLPTDNNRVYSPANYGRYGFADVTVRFKPLKTMIYASDFDSAWAPFLGQEQLRYFGRLGTDVGLDLLTVEGAVDDSGIAFAEGAYSGGTGPPTGMNSATNLSGFGGAVFTRREKTTFHCIWKQVPINYTCGEIKFTAADIASFVMPAPLRFVKALGTINKTNFPGANSPYKPGTLMLTAVKETVYQQPVRTNSPYGYPAADYEMTFEYFDPTRDCTAVVNPGTAPIDTAVAYGFDLFPYRPTRKWYLATTGDATVRGTQSGLRFYPKTEFGDIFQHISNTTYPLPPVCS